MNFWHHILNSRKQWWWWCETFWYISMNYYIQQYFPRARFTIYRSIITRCLSIYYNIHNNSNEMLYMIFDFSSYPNYYSIVYAWINGFKLFRVTRRLLFSFPLLSAFLLCFMCFVHSTKLGMASNIELYISYWSLLVGNNSCHKMAHFWLMLVNEICTFVQKVECT